MADKNFLTEIIDADLAEGKISEIHTRFPPEPNGYLHIGHAKSICLNFGLAEYNHGRCNLRFDDTNPTKEDTEYVDSIQEDIRWLGFSWGNRKFYASDYFDKLYDFAVTLIKKGLAYVDDLSAEEIKAYRRQTGATILLVSHSMEDVARHAQKILVMNAGKVFCYGTVENVFRRSQELQAIGLAVPQITRVCNALRAKGIPLTEDIFTVEQAKEQLIAWYRKKGEQ